MSVLCYASKFCYLFYFLLFDVFCFLRVFCVLCDPLFIFMYVTVYLHFTFKCKDHFHRAETQLQEINISYRVRIFL
jgi:hypothetical protein